VVLTTYFEKNSFHLQIRLFSSRWGTSYQGTYSAKKWLGMVSKRRRHFKCFARM